MSPQITTYRCAMHPGNELPTLTLMSMVIRILECTPERWMHMLHDLYLSNLSVTPRHAFNSSKKPIRLLCILFFLDRKKINLIYIFPRPDLFNQSCATWKYLLSRFVSSDHSLRQYIWWLTYNGHFAYLTILKDVHMLYLYIKIIWSSIVAVLYTRTQQIIKWNMQHIKVGHYLPYTLFYVLISTSIFNSESRFFLLFTFGEGEGVYVFCFGCYLAAKLF